MYNLQVYLKFCSGLEIHRANDAKYSILRFYDDRSSSTANLRFFQIFISHFSKKPVLTSLRCRKYGTFVAAYHIYFPKYREACPGYLASQLRSILKTKASTHHLFGVFGSVLQALQKSQNLGDVILVRFTRKFGQWTLNINDRRSNLRKCHTKLRFSLDFVLSTFLLIY
jgi:hypothetical protein